MRYFGKVTGAKEDNGTIMRVEIDENIAHKIRRFNQGEGVDVELIISDGREISTKQRKKIYATIKDMSDYLGYEPEHFKELMKYDYMMTTGEAYFSLSKCSVTTAKEFINHILEVAIREGIPLSDCGVNRTEDIDRYLFCCIKYRTCAITGKPGAHIHHCIGSKVGMGVNRSKLDHSKFAIIALCPELHAKVHNEGEDELFRDFKVYGIKVDKETLKDIGVQVKDIG